jgi:hypothetical protein
LRAQLRIRPTVNEQWTAPNSHLPVDVTAKPEPGNLKPSQSLSQRNPRTRKTIREFHDGTCFSRNISISGPMAWGSSRPLAAPTRHAPIDKGGSPSMLNI